MARNWKESQKAKNLRRALMEHLEARGLERNPVYQDKAAEYVDLWCRRQELKDDIEAHGLNYVDDRGRLCENRSVALEAQVCSRMMAIFYALKLADLPEVDGDEL